MKKGERGEKVVQIKRIDKGKGPPAAAAAAAITKCHWWWHFTCSSYGLDPMQADLDWYTANLPPRCSSITLFLNF